MKLPDLDDSAWAVILAQLIPAILLLMRAGILAWFDKQRLLDFCPSFKGKVWSAETQASMAATSTFHKLVGYYHHEVPPFSTERANHRQWRSQRADVWDHGNSIFCSHVRSEANFVLGNSDPELKLPPGSPMEVERPYHSRWMLYCILANTHHLFNVALASLGWGLLSGSFGSLLVEIQRTGDNKWISSHGEALGKLFSDYKWFPTFLLVGHLGFYVKRWRGFIFAAWGVEGRLKDMGLGIGCDVQDPSKLETRQLMFKIYRYKVLAMALQYKVIIPSLSKLGNGELLIKFLQEMGLLTSSEATVLAPAGSRMRDTVLSWIGIEVNNNGPQKTGLLMGNNTLMIMDNLAQCRGKMMYFHGNNFYPQPNMFAAMMKFVVDNFVMLAVVTYPFKAMIPFDHDIVGNGSCFQPITIAAVFSLSFAYLGCGCLAYALHAPFQTQHDTFNIDALIAGTEQTLFAYLRACFDDAFRASSVPKQEKTVPAQLL